MKSKILLTSLLGLATAFSISAINKANVEDAALKVGQRHTYIVTLKDTYTPNNRASFLYSLGNLLDNQYKIDATYSTIFQGYAINFPSSMVNSVRHLPGVTGVYGTSVYSMPNDSINDTTATDAYAADSHNSYSRETMDVDWTKQTNKGAGSTIGIIDTGLFFTQVANSADDTSEKAFRPLGSTAHEKAQFKDAASVNSKINSDSTFIGKGARFVNDKIFYTYDYSGNNDSNVQSTSGNDHGTHVASLATANGYKYQGIAPDAQLAVLKVFGDTTGGAATEDILEALEDSVRLGLDVVNMSLGQGLFSYPGYETDSIEALTIQKCKERGMILNVSAGNDGRESYNGASGFYANAQTTDTVETSELGSYATLNKWDNVIASGTSTYVDIGYMLVKDKDGKPVGSSEEDSKITSYTDQVDTLLFASIFQGDTKSYPYVKVPGVGAEENYKGLNVQGKIAIVQRGVTSFVDKAQQAIKAKAKALIITNTDDTDIHMSLTGVTPTIPIISVSKSIADKMFKNETGSIEYAVNKKQENKDIIGQVQDPGFPNDPTKTIDKVNYKGHGRELSTFSSDGPNTDLTLGIDIAAPGEKAYGAVDYGYKEMSGTSMSAPNFTGAMAMIVSEYRSQHMNSDGSYDTETVAKYRDKLMARIQSTALPLQDSDRETDTGVKIKEPLQPLKDSSGNVVEGKYMDGDHKEVTVDPYNFASPRRQGGGMVQVNKAVTSKVYFEQYDETKTTADKGTGKAKMEFLNTDEISEGILHPQVYVHNETSKAVTYKAKLYIAVPTAELGIDQDTWQSMTATSQTMVAPNIQFTTLQKNQDHLIGVYEYSSPVTINPTQENGVGQLVTLPAINLTDEKSSDAQVAALAKIFNNYMKNYKYGTYIEGYMMFEPTTSTEETPEINVPYSGFFSDYGKAPAAEEFDFEKDPNATYNSDIVSSVAHNLAGSSSANADLGSHIFAGSDAVTTGLIDIANAATGKTTYASIGLYNAGVDYNKNAYSKITVGVKGKSDVLYIQQYMNRMANYGEVTILDASGKAISNTTDMYSYPSLTYSSELAWVDSNGHTRHVLQKSFITQSALESGYFAPMTFARVPLKDKDGNALAKGDYKLQFHYQLAAKDSAGKYIEQTKEVSFSVGEDIQPSILGTGTVQNNEVLYISDDTAWVKVNGSYVTIGVYRGRRYISIGSITTYNGYVPLSITSTSGTIYNVLVDIYREDAVAIYGTDLSSASYFFVSESNDSTNKATKYTANVYNKDNRPSNGYLANAHGVSLKAKSKVSSVFAYDDSGKKVDLASIGGSYTYDETTSYLNVYLPTGYTSFGVIYA